STMSGGRLLIGCCGANLDIADSGVSGASFTEGGGSPDDGPVVIRHSTFTNTVVDLPSTAFIASDTIFAGAPPVTDAGVSTLIRIGGGSLSYCRVSGNSFGAGLESAGSGLAVAYTEFL